MIVTNNELLASSSSATYAINLTTHQQDWSYPVGGALALSENELYIADSNGELTAISAASFPRASSGTSRRGGVGRKAEIGLPRGPANGIDNTADFSQQSSSAMRPSRWTAAAASATWSSATRQQAIIGP